MTGMTVAAYLALDDRVDGEMRHGLTSPDDAFMQRMEAIYQIKAHEFEDHGGDPCRCDRPDPARQDLA